MNPRSFRRSLTGLALLLMAAGCGGQSGAEGGSRPGLDFPGPGASCASADVDELPFDPKWIERLANGKHTSTLGWRDPGLGEMPEEAGTQPVAIEVRQKSETRTSLHCGGSSLYEASVELRLSDGREAAFEGVVHGSRSGAFLVATGALSTYDALRIPGPRLTGQDGPQYEIVVQFDDGGMRGDLYFDAGSTGQCSEAAWPAERTCPLHQREVSADAMFDGVRWSEVVDQLNRQSRHALSWKDGSTTSIEILVDPTASPVCVGEYFMDLTVDGKQLKRLNTGVGLHVKSEDGRLDAQIPATLSVLWNDEQGIVSAPPDEYVPTTTAARLAARAIGRWSSDSEDDRFDSLELDASYDRVSVSGSVYIHTYKLKHVPAALEESNAPARTMQNGECLGLRGAEPNVTGTFRSFE